ncbi:phytoene desaturase family protein [Sulfitobacter sp. D35]|uniref:1-hydroxycarotenoid 3,4-desaturase CrtD n=1 Tax=Sulfitobacter sp. D35 TaxID=3083252 RepID=UPI00296F6623|nr:1-hydroxycarotenoid 3,4-desaturase CrtD [Sulfitobacter sp. D35]MDW4499423.1 phytoene desaturase family protein [Sulfitobacter sp. D35]
MPGLASETGAKNRAVVVGAGIGGLTSAARLAHAGYQVQIIDRHDAPGGKMRTLPSAAGPVDAGPTVLTMRWVFDALFAELGERLEDHLDLMPQHRLARHFWRDGSTLDLFDDEERNVAAIADFAGSRAAAQFRDFSARTRRLFDGFDAPMMRARAPHPARIVPYVLRRPALIPAMAPLSSLDALLDRSFDDPRLRQLFGRYATYVGGLPQCAPALLSLIWQSEARGVWTVRGGMHQLARAVEDLARRHGAQVKYNAHVASIETTRGAVRGVRLSDGTRLRADTVVFNGDPRALPTGQLGDACRSVARGAASAGRSLSAEVWAFAARPSGPELALHNVFFRDDAEEEFHALENGRRVEDPTLYVCAMDRGAAGPPAGPERFEIIANAPPLPSEGAETEKDPDRCRMRTFQTLAGFGLRFDPEPAADSLTTPHGFETLFPASLGSLYGQSPHGLMAAFRRPTARTRIAGLYLAGGGTHPGAGVPMAALSGRHAVETILSDRTSPSRSRPTATRGGTSTASGPAAEKPSASSAS